MLINKKILLNLIKESITEILKEEKFYRGVNNKTYKHDSPTSWTWISNDYNIGNKYGKVYVTDINIEQYNIIDGNQILELLENNNSYHFDTSNFSKLLYYPTEDFINFLRNKGIDGYDINGHGNLICFFDKSNLSFQSMNLYNRLKNKFK